MRVRRCLVSPSFTALSYVVYIARWSLTHPVPDIYMKASSMCILVACASIEWCSYATLAGVCACLEALEVSNSCACLYPPCSSAYLDILCLPIHCGTLSCPSLHATLGVACHQWVYPPVKGGGSPLFFFPFSSPSSPSFPSLSSSAQVGRSPLAAGRWFLQHHLACCFPYPVLCTAWSTQTSRVSPWIENTHTHIEFPIFTEAYTRNFPQAESQKDTHFNTPVSEIWIGGQSALKAGGGGNSPRKLPLKACGVDPQIGFSIESV